MKVRLLTATAQPGYPVLRQLFEQEADLVFVFTLEEAMRELAAGGYDLIVCTIHFDESRMFDLERQARALAPSVPFVCCRLLDSILRESMLESMRFAVSTLGGDFIDRQELHRRLGAEAGDAEFRKLVLSRAATSRAG
jgi:hypothetical protein